MAIWKSTLNENPPDIDPTNFGWEKDEVNKILLPVSLPGDTQPAPPYVQELVRCSCLKENPCSNARCLCTSACLPCTVFCACEGECCNPRNKTKQMVTSDTDEQEDSERDLDKSDEYEENSDEHEDSDEECEEESSDVDSENESDVNSESESDVYSESADDSD